MREILFRGVSTDSGEWTEGWFEMYPFVRWPLKETIIPAQEAKDGHFRHVEVIPETVGQFTGLTDKNGKKIFEDDIVVICYETDGEEFSETKRVHYNAKECCWYPMRWEEYCEHCDHYTEVKSIEVIGNIHDNPELLEVE